LEKVAHNGLAGRGLFRRVSPSFDAAPGGLCALQSIFTNASLMPHGRGELING
jgi:hypothetical protein